MTNRRPLVAVAGTTQEHASADQLRVGDALILAERATTVTPAAGEGGIYARSSDSRPHYVDDAGSDQNMLLTEDYNALAARISALETLTTNWQAAWTAFTPTWTNLTVGNATQTCAYIQIGKLIIARFRLVFGSTTVVSGTPQATVPVTAHANALRTEGEVAIYRDASATTNYAGIVALTLTTAVQFLRENVAGATDAMAGVSSTAPFTWATSDEICGTIMYEAA